MHHSTRMIFITLCVLVSAIASASNADAVPPASPPTDSPADSTREASQRERAKAIIEARLERLRAEESTLRATLAAIEAGQSLDELRIPGPPRDRRIGDRPDDRPDDGRDQQRGDEVGEEFSDEQIRAFIAEVYPEWMDRINQLERRDPEALRRLLRERRPRLVELMVEKRDHPAIFQARQRVARSEMMIRRAAWSLARAENDADRTQAESRLEALLGEQFDLRITLMEAELAEVEAEAQEKRQAIAEVRAKRDTLIAERKADLIQTIRERRPDGRRGDRLGGPERPGGPGRDDPSRRR